MFWLISVCQSYIDAENEWIRLGIRLCFLDLYSLSLSLFIRFLRQYNSGTQKLVKIPFIDGMRLNILQLLKLKFSQINKRGECPNKVGGMGKISEN